MASVAICPHCYLQLIVPDGVKSDEPVECPTCAKEFGLDLAVLRAIPEVVRRSPTATKTEAPVAELTLPTAVDAEAAVPEAAVDETVEVEDLVSEADGQREAVVIDEIKARIEAEIAASGLHRSTNMVLPLELPADAGVESSPEVEPVERDVAAWFQHAETAPESPAEEELPQELDLAADLDDEAKTQAAEETAEMDEAKSEQVLEQAEAENDVAPEPSESDFPRPATTTLADLMPPREEQEVHGETDEAPGPSFDLPNVPLTPTSAATVEIDPSMSFGPAAEPEFELDDVDFETTPVEEPVADEAAEANEPVFREPDVARLPAEPFVLPGILRPRKRRSAIRTVMGVAVGGVAGTIVACFMLLYLLGPEGDLLHVAQYIPSVLLPKSFQTAPSQVAEAAPATPVEPAAEQREDAESANVPAGYSEEVMAPAESVATYESPGDDRYGTEPSPLEEPAAEPIADETPPTTIAPLPLRGPTFTVDQLATALQAGKEAQVGLTAGDLSDASVRRTKGMSYAKLCDLAEALTFVDRSAPSVESEQAIEGADRLFRATLADAHTRNEVARIAQIWIDSPHRAHGGVFLAGTASGGQIAGDVYEYELTDDDGGRLTLLMQEPLDPLVESSDHPVGVVGSIVDDPAGQIAGYRGTAKRAIWVARAISLD